MATIAEEVDRGIRHERESSATGAERRKYDRLSYHTVVTALIADDNEFHVQRCWLGDISAAGARILSRKPLGHGELFLQILMDGMSGRFVVAEIVNERVIESDRVGDRRSQRYVYGVRLKDFVSNSTVLEKLQLAIPSQPPASSGA